MTSFISLMNENLVGLYPKKMRVISTIKDLQDELRKLNVAPAGLVPTMGALHDGHLALAGRAVKQCRVVVVSIFVNPTQFNDKDDFRNYPRTLDSDISILKNVLRDHDMVFNPTESEIYPVKDTRVFDFGSLGSVMEGLHRPGHFNGVAQVVSRLFEITAPDYAYFGEKDFQQLAIVRDLVRQTGNKVKIIGIPIIRESDGLAMSSRNRLLDPLIRKNAGIIYKTLLSASLMMRNKDLPGIKEFVMTSIDQIPGFKTEYFEIVEENTLVPLHSRAEILKGHAYRGCIALRAGKIRLIDNIEMHAR
jgi:pantoate--beta-alanine ligase